jgi:hypothetical protein
MDALLHSYEGGDAVQPCEIKVRIPQEYQDKVTLYLGVPSKRVLQQGYLPDKDSSFIFNEFEQGADFPLPWGVRCFILGIGEKDGTPLIGYAEFSTKDQQTINLDIRTTTKDQLKEYYRKLDVPDTTHPYDNIGGIGEPGAKCDCDCGRQPARQ